MKQVCRWCEEEVDEEVWASGIEKNGVTVFICDYCGKQVDHDTLLEEKE